MATPFTFALRSQFSQSEFEDMMRELAAADVSDITIETDKPIYVRLHADQLRVTPRSVAASEVRNIVSWVYGGNAVAEIASGKQGLNRRYEIMRENPDTQLIERVFFRFNAVACQTTRGGGGISCTFRTIPTRIPVLDSPYMRLPEALLRAIMNTNDGLTLVVGETGQGKTSLLAAWMRHKFVKVPNRKIVTGEAPVEYDLNPLHTLHPEASSLISQREIGRGRDMESFYQFIVEALRQGPTDILIGEARDQETIRGMLHASESGHCTITTLHSDAVDTSFLRVANEFSSEYFNQIIFKLVSQVRLVVVQKLLRPAIPGNPRVPVREWLEFDDDFRWSLMRMKPMEAIFAINEEVRKRGQSLAQQAKLAFDDELVDERQYLEIARQEAIAR